MEEDLFGVSWKVYHMMKSGWKNPFLKEHHSFLTLRSDFKS